MNRRVMTAFWLSLGLVFTASGCRGAEGDSARSTQDQGGGDAPAPAPSTAEPEATGGKADGSGVAPKAEHLTEVREGASELAAASTADAADAKTEQSSETPAESTEIKDDLAKTPPPTEKDILKKLPSGSDQLKLLCSRPGQDKVRAVFCGPNPPKITSLVDLQRSLGLGIVDPTRTGRGQNGSGGNAAFTFTAGSSSLVAKFTSAINPRLIMFTPPTGNFIPDLVALGFVRGEQFAEVIARDPGSGNLNFFLVTFEQDCNEKPKDCDHAHLLTADVESNWRKLTIYEDTDLVNTIFDCKQCHQPGGEGTPKILRMQELRNPWTHFFRNNNDGGRALLADFEAAHGTDQAYAGIPGPMIAASEPLALERLVRQNGFEEQPNEFQSRRIENEVADSSPTQPADNSQMGSSATWELAYEEFVKGRAIPPPYHDVKVTAPQKLAKMTAAIVAVRNGTMPREMMPDIREIFPEAAMRNLGFGVKEGSSGAEIITQACAQCHNSKLPQNISRARFDVDLSKMSREAKDKAIARLKLDEHDPLRMPPALFRSLTPEEIERAIEELKK
jgi:mono/diheme cytochrome c family protein